MRLDNDINLDEIYKESAKIYMNKSVYFYTGSDTVPPCEEGVMRFVFAYPIYISKY